MVASQKVKVVKGFKVPSKVGRYYRLLCLTGKNKGTSYFLQSSRIVLGRSDKADIMIADTKSSREHAELTFLKDEYIITDLSSQNGVVVNDLKILQHQLNNGDKIIIGQTVYKYDLIENKKPNLSLVSVEDDSKTSDGLSLSKGGQYSYGEINSDELTEEKDERKNTRIGVILVIGLIFYFFLGEDSPQTGKVKTKDKQITSVRDSFAEKLIAKTRKEDQEQAKKLEAILKRGLREYREGNFFRAIHEFNLALILSPDNSRAQFYLSKSRQRLHETVDSLLEKGQREIEANKYLEAKVTFCSILRLLKDEPSHDSYKSAQGKIDIIEIELGYVKGEIKCFRKIDK